MKITLVTTTIRVPEVLRLYRAYGPDVRMLVAADDKTPVRVVDFCSEIGAQCFQPSADDDAWKCSRLIGRNTIGRRSIAILEALRWGADTIVSVDDDNIPMDCLYFNEFKEILSEPFNGLRVDPATWFNVGALCDPFFVQRGFPHTQLPNCYGVDPVVSAKVGVAAGVAFGDPDVGAHDRIAGRAYAARAHEILRAGVVFRPEPGKWTVFNTQVVAFLRELAPCFLMVPQFNRYDDIYASLICQRVMRERGLVVHHGRPFVYQARNEHDLLKDAEAEMFGARHIHHLASWLDRFEFRSISPLGMVRELFEDIASAAWCPPGVSELGLAWISDCESVL